MKKVCERQYRGHRQPRPGLGQAERHALQEQLEGVPGAEPGQQDGDGCQTGHGLQQPQGLQLHQQP